MKPAAEITDRAKRYRAHQNRPAGPKRCTLCSSRRNVDIDHITGDEADGEPENLMWLCRPCNARKAIAQLRNKIGIRTRQYNPRRAPGFKEFQNAGLILTGLVPGDVAEATAVIYQTPPETRLEYAERIEALNPFRSEAQRRKFFAMAGRGEISQATLDKWRRETRGKILNPVPTFKQYAFAASIHQRGAHDEGGEIIHATPPAVRSLYARRIAAIKRSRAGSVPF